MSVTKGGRSDVELISFAPTVIQKPYVEIPAGGNGGKQQCAAVITAHTGSIAPNSSKIVSSAHVKMFAQRPFEIFHQTSHQEGWLSIGWLLYPRSHNLVDTN